MSKVAQLPKKKRPGKSKPKSRMFEDIRDGMLEVISFLKGEKNTGVTVSFAPHPDPIINCGLRLKARRMTEQLKIEQVAEKTGLSRETIVKIEAGDIADVTWKSLSEYAAALGCCMTLGLKKRKRESKQLRASA